MTDKVSDGDKLVASIKRTRSADAPAATTPAKAPAKKSVARKATRSTRKKAAPAAKKESPSRNQAAIELFQHGRRVWPD